MSRPPLEVADLVRAAGEAFIERNRQWIRWKHVKVLLAIARCRTAALGGHIDECTRCGHRAISYNSCRNRHCPKCQAGARERWIAARQKELLPTRYLHVVFTLPRGIRRLCLPWRAPHLCALPSNRSFLSASSTAPSRYFFAVAAFRSHRLLGCAVQHRLDTPTNRPPPTIEFT